MTYRNYFILLLIIFLSVGVLYLSFSLRDQGLIFVDAARYADIAKHLVLDKEYTTTFNFPTKNPPGKYGWEGNLPPVHIYIIAGFFYIFGINDTSVILASSIFFILNSALVYLLALKIFNQRIAFFSALFFIFNPQFINYALDGATEQIFTGELLLTTLLIYRGGALSCVVPGIIIGLSLFTKLQGYLTPFIYIFLLMMLYGLKWRKSIYLLMPPIIMVIFNRLGILFGEFIFTIPYYLLLQQSALFIADDLPRSGKTNSIVFLDILINLKIILSKFFYNIYNFYKIIIGFDKSLPFLTTPFIVVTYALSNILIIKEKYGDQRTLRIFTATTTGAFLVLAAFTSPHIRYIHPVIPFLIILSIAFIEDILEKMNYAENSRLLILTIFFTIFSLNLFLGFSFLDTRYLSKTNNLEKPHIQKVLGDKLSALIDEREIVITNIDTWGSWYGNRFTMLIPVNFSVLEEIDNSVNIDKIFLTDFQIDNEDHPLKGEWRILYEHPDKGESSYFSRNFKFIEENTIDPSMVYEKKRYTYKIWVKK